MKKILVDIYKTNNLYSGLGQFSLHFANELLKQKPEDFDINFLFKKSSELKLESDDFHAYDANTLRRFIPSYNKSFDIWHSLHQFPSYAPPKGVKQILTIHDLNFLIEKNSTKQIKYKKRLQANINRADYLTCISQFTKGMVQDHFDLKNKEISVIHNGVETSYNQSDTKPDFVKEHKFFFSIGIFNSKKNFHSLIPLLEHFPDYKLVIAGNHETSYGAIVKEEILNAGFENRVVLPGKISEEIKHTLYAHCEAFLFPSLAEGFGMPPIEAMMVGKPVFLSQETSLPEIGGKQAFYFDSFEPKAMADLICEKLKLVKLNSQFSDESKKYADRFSWQMSMKAYLDFYKKIA